MKKEIGKGRKNLFCLFLGMWLAFSITQPVQAQWAVSVVNDTSPTTFQMLQQMAQQLAAQTSISVDAKASKLAQVAEYIKTAQRWVETVNFWSNQILGDIRRFTSLKGILSTVESQLGLSDDALKALRDVGEIIRGAFTLKNSFLSLVRTRLQMIESLERRARQGIFNPQADLQDLEDYLRYSIGKQAGATLASRQRLSEIDPLIERLTYDLQKVRAERAAKQKELDGINQQLGRENSLSSRPRVVTVDQNGNSNSTPGDNRTSLSPEAVQTLTLRAGQLEAQIQELSKRETELINEIQARYEAMQKNYTSAYLQGRYWQSVLQGWDKFEEVKRREIENLIDTYEATPNSTPIIP